jgi:hypothetical protein
MAVLQMFVVGGMGKRRKREKAMLVVWGLVVLEHDNVGRREKVYSIAVGLINLSLN